jgi:hypothetical protein
MRTIRVEPNCSFSAFLERASIKLDMENKPFLLSYYFAWGRKSMQTTLEGEQEWHDLVDVALANHHRKLSGPHMIFLECLSGDEKDSKGSAKKAKELTEAVRITTQANFYVLTRI